MKQWIVFRLLMPEEFQEQVANFLMEQGATGLEEEIKEGSKEIAFKAYFLKDGGEKRVKTNLRRYMKSIEIIFSRKVSYRVSTAVISEQDWGENWKQFFKPLRIGSKLVVFPPWEKARLKEGEVPIEITPGMAFGTGTHGTTQLCIEALEKRLKKRSASVLDVGTGSGILAIVAAKLGTQEVLAIDTDPVAVEVAAENVEKNGVQGVVRVRRGEVGRIRKRFDIVVANIDFKGLERLKLPLIRRVKNEGYLILSGILKEEEDKIRQDFLETKALRFVERDRRGEWSCLTFRRGRKNKG
jgi:ribosomal protein L11 methyltransferase